MTVCLSPNGPMVFKDTAPDNLFVATIHGVVELAKAGDGKWEIVRRSLEDVHVSAVLKDDVTGQLIASSHGDGIFASSDGGESWEPRNDGLTRMNVFSLATGTEDGKPVILAGTEPVSLFVSFDGAKTWKERPAAGQMEGREHWTFPVPPHDAHLKALAVDPHHENTLYGCVEQGALLKSEDGGKSWIEISSYYKPEDRWYRDIHKVIFREDAPETILMTTGMGFYRSDDRGESWEHLTDLDFDIRYPDHIVVTPEDSNTIILSGAGQSPDQWKHTHISGATVMMSPDGGKNWVGFDHGLDPSTRPAIEAMSIAIHDGGYTLFLGNTDGDIYVRPKGADSWTLIAEDVGAVSKVGHYKHVQPQMEAHS